MMNQLWKDHRAFVQRVCRLCAKEIKDRRSQQAPLRVVVRGDLNTGKSTLINALVGRKICATGALPTTTVPQTVICDDILELKLRGIEFVDTSPNSSDIGDVYLDCVGADRPVPSSAAFPIVTKLDILEDTGGNHGAETKRAVLDYVNRDRAIGVAAKPHLQLSMLGQAYERGNIRSLTKLLLECQENVIYHRLMKRQESMERLLDEKDTEIRQEKDKLLDDVATVNYLETQIQQWDSQMRLKIPLVVERLSGKDEPSVSKTGAPRNIPEPSLVRSIADEWAILARQQGQTMIESLGNRPSRRGKSMVGSITAASNFTDHYNFMKDGLRQAIQESNIVTSDGEQERLTSSQQLIGHTVTFIGSVATGIGVLSELIDMWTGTIFISSLLGSNAILQTILKNRLKTNSIHIAKIQSEVLEKGIRDVCNKALDRMDRRLRAGVSNYTGFVTSEETRVSEIDKEVEELWALAKEMRLRIESLVVK